MLTAISIVLYLLAAFFAMIAGTAADLDRTSQFAVAFFIACVIFVIATAANIAGAI